MQIPSAAPDTRGVDRAGMFYWQVDRPFSADEIQRIFLYRAQDITADYVKTVITAGLQRLGRTGAAAAIAAVGERFGTGSVNLVYPVRVHNGDRFIVRIHPQAVRNGYFWVESLATAAARKAGVPTYETLLVDDSRELVDADYMLLTEVYGKNMQSAGPFEPAVDRELVRDTGRVLAKLHGVMTNGFGFFDNRLAKEQRRLRGIHDSWPEHLLAALEENIRYLRDTGMLDLLQTRTIENIFSRYDDFIRCDAPVLVQNDVADWNQLTDGKQITGLVDWDECFSGDAVCEFAAWSVFYPFSRMEHLIEGYLELRSLPDGYREKLHLYRLRYVLSKMTGRKKKLEKSHSTFIESLLRYAVTILEEELKFLAEKKG